MYIVKEREEYTMFNKAEIMKQAWNWFTDSNVWLSDIEWVSYTDKKKLSPYV